MAEAGAARAGAEQAPSSASKRTRLEQADPSIKLDIEDTEHMSQTYVRTRHKNVRCFPRCSAVHKTKSFCGSCVYVSVRGKTFKRENTIIVGEFRSTKSQPSLHLNQELESLDFSESYTEGVLLKQEGDHMSFAINPVRKWKFDSKLRPTDFYVFTVFLVAENKIMAVKDTPSFSIIPIWKTEGSKDDDGEDEDGAAPTTVKALSTKDSAPMSKIIETPPPPPPKSDGSPSTSVAPSLSISKHVPAMRPAYVPRLLPDHIAADGGNRPFMNMVSYDFSHFRSSPTAGFSSPPQTVFSRGTTQQGAQYADISAVHQQHQQYQQHQQQQQQHQQQLALFESIIRQQQQPARTWAPQINDAVMPWGGGQNGQSQIQLQQPQMTSYGTTLPFVPVQYPVMRQYPN